MTNHPNRALAAPERTIERLTNLLRIAEVGLDTASGKMLESARELTALRAQNDILRGAIHQIATMPMDAPASALRVLAKSADEEVGR